MESVEKKTQVIRVILASVLIAAVAYPEVFQSILNASWEYLKTNAFYKSSVFETVWTVFCYAAIEPFITFIFIQHPEMRLAPPKRQSGTGKKAAEQRTQPKGMRRPSRRLREGLTYVAPLLLMDVTMIKKFADVPLEAKLASGNYDFSTLQSSSSHSGHFLQPSLHNFTLSSPLQTTRALPASAPSSRRLALELLAAIFIYDALFFAFHLAMHTVPLLRALHAKHHTHTEIHPQITNQLSVFERLGLVLLANFSLNIIGSHVLTRTLFVPLFVWLLVEIHSGIDAWWSSERVLPKGWAGGTTRHRAHHERGLDGGGVEPFFCWWDELFVWIVGSTRMVEGD